MGTKVVCMDPGFSLAQSECLVVASRPVLDASFDAGAARLGCEVHSFGPDRGRLLEPSLSTLPGGRRPIGVLALHMDVEGLVGLLHRPPASLRRVEQLTVRLNLTSTLTAKVTEDAPLLRRLYRGLLRLQRLGFHPFSSEPVDDNGVEEIRLAGKPDPISSVQEIGWMKVLCDAGDGA